VKDTAPDAPRGSGLGLELARKPAERAGAEVEAFQEKGRFRQVVLF